MWKKIIWVVVISEIIISWPLSMIKNPPHFDKETIFYKTTEEENWNFEKKIALDTSRFKRVYYNKVTIVKDRYLKNFLVLVDLNNYFFAMHPREDVSGVNYRFKYPFVVILFLILVIKESAKNKKYAKIWWIILIEILILSFLKQVDGWDIILFFPITFLLVSGSKKVSEWKFGWMINLVLIMLMTEEIGRIFL